jgi:hypothetical protein
MLLRIERFPKILGKNVFHPYVQEKIMRPVVQENPAFGLSD